MMSRPQMLGAPRPPNNEPDALDALAPKVTPMIEVIGVGAAGFASLCPVIRTMVRDAPCVISSQRLLATLPDNATQQRRPWPHPISSTLVNFIDQLPSGSVVLASGDPMVSGVGSTLVRLLGVDAVRVHPAISSVSLARARLGWAAETVTTLSLVNCPTYVVRAALAPCARLVLLSAGRHTPVEVARELVDAGWGRSQLTVLGNLGATSASSRQGTALVAADWTHDDLPALNAVAVEAFSDNDAAILGRVPGLPDDSFAHDGQLTKTELRAIALSALRPQPGELLWDLGAGAGSVAIEWARTDLRCTAIAIERDAERASTISTNAYRLGTPNVRVECGTSADIIAELPLPDAVFVGGGANDFLVDTIWRRLRPGGRLVMHAVTLQTEQVLITAQQRFGGALRRLSIERADPLGNYLSWTPMRPVIHLAVTRSTDETNWKT